MAYDPDFPDALIDNVEVPSPFWNISTAGCHNNHLSQCTTTRCSICGLHITDRERPHTGPWLYDAFLIGDLSREYEYVQTNRKYHESDQEPAVFSANIGEWCSPSKGCGYRIGRTGLLHTRKSPFFAYAADANNCNGGPDGKNTVYIPMHRACFHIALRSPRWDGTQSTALRTLFRVLRHRFQVSLEQRLNRPRRACDDDQIGWPDWDSRYMAFIMNGFQNTQGVERGYFSRECLDREFWERDHYLLYDPLDIPSLTDTLLKNLEPRNCPAISKASRPLRKRLRALPNELVLLIYEHLIHDQDWPLECTRVLGAHFWKTLFNKNYPCMEWLWDLDFRLIQGTDPNLGMDWELLFRKISQAPKVPDCHEQRPNSDYEIFRGVLSHVPPGLEGRRRIWKLVEEMRVGDRSTRWEMDTGYSNYYDQELQCRRNEYLDPVRDIPEVPVYWGPDGETLNEEELRALQ